MDVIKKLSTGVPGTKRYLREYGDRLVCIRYIVMTKSANAD